MQFASRDGGDFAEFHGLPLPRPRQLVRSDPLRSQINEVETRSCELLQGTASLFVFLEVLEDLPFYWFSKW